MRRIIYIFLCTATLWGCTIEFGKNGNGVEPDPTPTPEPGTQLVDLDFQLVSGAAFVSNVRSVDVTILDAVGNYVRTEKVKSVDNMQLSLPVGNYRLVFWGNLGANSMVDEGWITHAAPGVNVDKLYYGPCVGVTRAGEAQSYFPLSVTENGGEGVINFTHAHRTLALYIDGFPANEQPSVEMSGLPAGLSFSGMSVQGGTTSQTVTAKPVSKDEKTYSLATFNTFRFDDPSGITIVIRNAAGEEVVTTTLADMLNGVDYDTEKIEIELVVKVDFINASVDISLPGWDGVNIVVPV